MKSSATTFPVFRLAAVLCFLAIGISCSDDDNEDFVEGDTRTATTSVRITTPPETRVIDNVIQINIDSILQLSAIVEAETNVDQRVMWSNTNTSVATVDTTGLVRAIAEGLTTITVTSQENPEARDTVRIRVAQANTIFSFGIQGIENVQPTITDTEVIFEIDFNIEGKALDVAELTTVVTHNGTTVSAPQATSFNTAPFTATLTENFTGGAVAYTVSGEDGEARTYQVSVKAKPETEFITTWNTATITVPTNPEFTYNYNIDTNNDGFIDQTGLTGDVPVEFSGMERTLRISGQFPAIRFLFSSQRNNISSVEQWGTVAWESMNAAFFGCDSLEVPAADVPDLSKVSSLASMFTLTPKANPDVSQWDTSNITSMAKMFESARNANPEVSNWDTSNVINMSDMFAGADNANPNVSQWDTSKVENMEDMFNFNARATPNVEQWNTSSVTNMRGMFDRATSANPNVSQWDTSNVTDMARMFSGASNAKPNVSQWNTSNVTNMESMFFVASSANPNVRDWDTSKVTNMRLMFLGAASANPDVSQWNISSIQTSNSSRLLDIFDRSALSRENYEKALIRFAEHATDPNNEGLSLPQNIDIGTVSVTFCSDAAAQAKAILEANGWMGIGNRGTDCN